MLNYKQTYKGAEATIGLQEKVSYLGNVTLHICTYVKRGELLSYWYASTARSYKNNCVNGKCSQPAFCPLLKESACILPQDGIILQPWNCHLFISHCLN